MRSPYGEKRSIVKQTLTALLLSIFLAPALEAQERVKFPIGVSSKVLGYAIFGRPGAADFSSERDWMPKSY